MISDRTKAALAAAKARGVLLGANGANLASAHKAKAELFADGIRAPVATALKESGWNLSSVANYLNQQGLTTRQGACWSPETVRRVLQRLSLR